MLFINVIIFNVAHQYAWNTSDTRQQMYNSQQMFCETCKSAECNFEFDYNMTFLVLKNQGSVPIPDSGNPLLITTSSTVLQR